MIDRQNIITCAQREVGTKESPAGSNKTKYGKWYGIDGIPWCGTSVSYIFNQAGYPLPAIDKGQKGVHYIPTLHARADQKKLWTTSPKPGDLVLFDFKPADGKKIAQHIGIYASTNKDGTVMCFEGNTAPAEKGSQDNGGSYEFKKRDKKFVLGFVDIEKLFAAYGVKV